MTLSPDGRNPSQEDDNDEPEITGTPVITEADSDIPETKPETDGFPALLGSPAASNPNTINAPFGALYNLTDDVFIYGKDIDRRVYPSGAAKLLTALTVCDVIELDFVFQVGEEIGMISLGSGVAGLARGQELDLISMLTALLIPIGNDAAYTISVNTARSLSESDNLSNSELNRYFLSLMNQYARKLGAENSNFSNPDGFHASDNYSTVRDLALIAAASAKNPLISTICGKPEHEVTFKSGETYVWSNSNNFLNIANRDIRGLRTGYTDESGFSAQILARIDGKDYIVVVSGSETSAARERDVLRLLDLVTDGIDADVISVYDG
ncbi:MAG: hypothetical protein FWE60_01625 [Oscillospiraceae bacterium]|nr:hypothetical protein [Oscillospiraceae bacterium]